MRSSPLAAGLLIGVRLLGTGGGLHAETSLMDNDGPAWRRLEYEAAKLGFRIRASVEFSRVSGADPERSLIETDDGNALRSDPRGQLLLEIRSRALDRSSLVEFWFRSDGGALRRRQLETGGKTRHNRFKINRYCTEGVFSSTRRPSEGEVSKPHEEWSERSERHEAIPPRTYLEYGPLSEPSVLFYLVSVARLAAPGDTVSLPLLDKGRVVLVTLTVSATTRIKVGYDEDSETGTHRRVDRVEALTLGLESRALGADAGEKDFRFLGLGGDIVLYVDPTQGIPLRISGNMRYAGRAHLKLRRVVLA